MADKPKSLTDDPTKLRTSPSVVVLASKRGYRAFEIENRKMYALNPAAAIVLELADGSRSKADLIETLVPLVGRDKADRCRAWIDSAIEMHLLIDHASHPASTAPDVKTLTDIASEFRWNDDVETAYLLQRQAVEMDPDDPEQWYRLAELAHIVGDRETARSAYEHYAQHHPEDAEVRHILIALRGEALPARASDDCIEQIYRKFADFYESNMCDDLLYRAPDHLAAALAPWLKATKSLEAVDLGCGTGLFGTKLRPSCHRLVGVDLSAAMLEKAGDRNVYDELECAEITTWLNARSGESFDLITCCDTLIYFGDLTEVISAAVARLRPGGVLGFTLEKTEHAPLELADSGRFRHHRSHVGAAAKAAGANVIRIDEKVLRREYGDDVIGLVSVLQKKDSPASRRSSRRSGD